MYLDFEESLGLTQKDFQRLLLWAESEIDKLTFDRLTYMWPTLPTSYQERVKAAARELILARDSAEKSAADKLITEEKVGEYAVKYGFTRPDQRLAPTDPKEIIARHLLRTGLMYQGYIRGEPYGF